MPFEITQIDLQKDPSQIDLKRSSDGKAFEGIFSLQRKGDRLKICLRRAERGRPKQLSSEPSSETLLLILKRKARPNRNRRS
jgi:hypothetical protein